MLTMPNITDEEISFVVQGEYSIYTESCLASIRKHFPRSEIILSTWKSNDAYDDINIDHLVMSEDPGTYNALQDTPAKYNLDRQLVSTQNGIIKATRKYIAKVRSDLVFENTNFLKYYADVPSSHSKYSIFQNKILITDVYTRNPLKMKKQQMLFHIGDFFYFGLTQDIQKLFDIPLSKKEVALYFLDGQKVHSIYKQILFKYTPEQYIILKNVQKIEELKDIDLRDHVDLSCKLFELHLNILVNNFSIVEWKNSGITSLKHTNIDVRDLYTEKEFDTSTKDISNNKLFKYRILYFYYLIYKVNIKKMGKDLKRYFRFQGNRS